MKLIRLPNVIDRVGLKKTTIYDLIKAEQFPEQIKVCGASLWIETEIDAWIMAQISASRPGASSTILPS